MIEPPVVTISSTINTLDFLGILKPLLKIRSPPTRSAKIPFVPSSFATPEDINIPPIAALTTISIFLNALRFTN